MSAKLQANLLSGPELHQAVVLDRLLEARQQVWLATADLKDMHIKRGRRFTPVLEVFDEMAARGVGFRIIHAALPTRAFRTTLESFPRLTGGALELQICSRSHWKMLIVDGSFAYLGSANFTGAGLGARATNRRNFELGMASEDPALVQRLQALFDEFWMGSHCESCKLRARCPDPIR